MGPETEGVAGARAWRSGTGGIRELVCGECPPSLVREFADEPLGRLRDQLSRAW